MLWLFEPGVWLALITLTLLESEWPLKPLASAGENYLSILLAGSYSGACNS